MPEKTRKIDIWQWLAIERDPDLAAHPVMGRFLSGVLFTVALVLVALPLGLLGQVTRIAFSSEVQDIRGLDFQLLGVAGLPFLVWRSVVAQRQVEAAYRAGMDA